MVNIITSIFVGVIVWPVYRRLVNLVSKQQIITVYNALCVYFVFEKEYRESQQQVVIYDGCQNLSKYNFSEWKRYNTLTEQGRNSCPRLQVLAFSLGSCRCPVKLST